MNSISTRKLPSGTVEAKFGELVVVIRERDGYINATRLCKDGGKAFADWKRMESSSSFLECLSSDMGIPMSALIDISKGGDPHQQGTWVHPEAAIQIAQWISPEYAQKVSSVMLRYHRGDLTVAAETLANHDALHGTVSTMNINSVLGKRKAELELDERSTQLIVMKAEAQKLQAEAEKIRVEARERSAQLALEIAERLKPADDAPEIEHIRTESDRQNLLAYAAKVAAGGPSDAPARALTDGRGEEISFALLEQRMGVRLSKAQRMKAGKRMMEVMKGRYGEDFRNPKRVELVDGRPMDVNAYWAKDEDLMRAAIDSTL